MMTIRTLTRSNLRRAAWIACSLLSVLCAGTATASAADNDFGPIVHEIEARYHVHRNFRFLMGLAGLTVRMTHIAGAKDAKMALFDDQRLDATDAELDELVMSVGARGWQPLVRSFDRRSGEHTYIYARDLGKDLRLLLVTMEPNESVVIELTVNQNRLAEFIDRRQHHGMRVARNRGDDESRIHVQPGAEIEVAAAPLSGRGSCALCSKRVSDLP